MNAMHRHPRLVTCLLALCLPWSAGVNGLAAGRAAEIQGLDPSAPARLGEAARRAELLFLTPGGSAPAIPVRHYAGRRGHPPVLMTHGLQSHSAWFAQSAAQLAAWGYPVYAPDRRGSGLSEAARGECRSFREWVDELNTVADFAMSVHDAGQVIVVGHCFGAIPAAAFVASRPEAVRALILSTPGIYTLTDLPLDEKLAVGRYRLLGQTTMLPVPLDPEMFTDDPAFVRFIRADPLALREATASFYSEVDRARGFIQAHAGQLTMPIFMANAGGDGICDNPANETFLARLPSTAKTLKTYPGARHVLEFSSERAAFFRDLGRWLKDLEKQP
jgi:alpha-beta hydrolase superfamily lysophospholipase